MRFYISQTIYTDIDGDGDFAFRPAVANYVGNRRNVDMRIDKTAHGKMFVECSPTAQQHIDMQADPLITYVPIEGAGGVELTLDSTLSEIPTAKRNTLRIALENRQVPLDDLTNQSTVRDLLKRIILRLHIRSILKGIDIEDGLDLDIGATKRDIIKAKFESLGITGVTKTIARELIKEIHGINHKVLRTHYDN